MTLSSCRSNQAMGVAAPRRMSIVLPRCVRGVVQELRGKTHPVRLERGTVLVFGGYCDESEIEALKEPKVMRLLSTNGFTRVECGDATIPVY